MFPEQNSRVTLELRQVLESGVDLWAFDYPSYYKGDDKKAFEKKVIDHFYLRQIGAETVGRFLHFFRRTMREIMPLYIQRYESVDLMKDPDIRPLDNYNMIEEYTGSGETEATGKSNGKGSRDLNIKSKDSTVHSDTPQGKLGFSVGIEADENLELLGYASDTNQQLSHNVTGEESEASEASEQTGKHQDTHKLTRRGNIGVTTYAQLLEGYRETFLNIDMEIIDELEICFLGVY